MKITKEVKEYSKNKNKVLNFMGGISFTYTPIHNLKLITSSSIFLEPKFYNKQHEYIYTSHCSLMDKGLLFREYEYKAISDIMEDAIDKALSYDYKATLEWAVELRNKYYMRFNPQVIIVRASIHPNRVNFNKKNPGFFRNINKQVMSRGDDPIIQFTYYLYLNKGKQNNIPNILKKSWCECISSYNAYKLNKYKNHHVGLINTIRICHANNELINVFLKNKLTVTNEKATWENLRSQKKSWQEIIESTKVPYFALLKNLRGIAKEIVSVTASRKICLELENGVLKSKVFPFRYYQAMKAIKSIEVHNKTSILNSLETCMDISLSNLPILEGRTACLSDNSGSCWGAFTSEYGNNTIAEINNLSSVLCAVNSQQGEVIKFGDNIKIYPVSNRNGVLYQASHISENKYDDVGGKTETGIWLFFQKAISDKIKYDNIFIYSDQQAGHGGLYGHCRSMYPAFSINNSRYIDVIKLIETYRKKVYKDVNIFIVQTAGYKNALLPDFLYRTYILSGWTGKELIFADAVNKVMK